MENRIKIDDVAEKLGLAQGLSVENGAEDGYIKYEKGLIKVFSGVGCPIDNSYTIPCQYLDEFEKVYTSITGLELNKSQL